MLTATATLIVTNPAQHPASLRLLAWCALKTARGQTVRQSTVRQSTVCTTRRAPTQTASGAA